MLVKSVEGKDAHEAKSLQVFEYLKTAIGVNKINLRGQSALDG